MSTRRGAKFPAVKGTKAVKVSPGKGGVQTGMPTHCPAKRASFRPGY